MESVTARDLISLALASCDFYAFVKVNERQIAQQSLSLDIEDKLLSTATSVWTARGSSYPASWVLNGFMEQLDLHKDDFLRACNLSRARDLVDHHRIIQGFAERMEKDFLDLASTRFEHCGRESDTRPAETLRILRAIYHFDLYFAIFAPQDKIHHNAPRLPYKHKEARKVFWDGFVPWEIEQVACVYDWFLPTLIPVYDTVALTVPRWTEWAAACEFMMDHGDYIFLQAELAQSLEYINKMILYAESPVDISMVPEPDTGRDTWHSHSIEESLNATMTLPQQLLQNTYWYWPPLRDLERDAPHFIAMLIHPPSREDDDPGPEVVWRWAHQNERPSRWPRSGLVLSNSQIPLREIGYVFWDVARLKSWGLLQSDWEGFDPTEREDAMQEERDRVQEKVEILADEIDTKRRAALRHSRRMKESDGFFSRRYG
jgi:hypothetical protein